MSNPLIRYKRKQIEDEIGSGVSQCHPFLNINFVNEVLFVLNLEESLPKRMVFFDIKNYLKELGQIIQQNKILTYENHSYIVHYLRNLIKFNYSNDTTDATHIVEHFLNRHFNTFSPLEFNILAIFQQTTNKKIHDIFYSDNLDFYLQITQIERILSIINCFPDKTKALFQLFDRLILKNLILSRHINVRNFLVISKIIINSLPMDFTIEESVFSNTLQTLLEISENFGYENLIKINKRIWSLYDKASEDLKLSFPRILKILIYYYEKFGNSFENLRKINKRIMSFYNKVNEELKEEIEVMLIEKVRNQDLSYRGDKNIANRTSLKELKLFLVDNIPVYFKQGSYVPVPEQIKTLQLGLKRLGTSLPKVDGAVLEEMLGMFKLGSS